MDREGMGNNSHEERSREEARELPWRRRRGGGERVELTSEGIS